MVKKIILYIVVVCLFTIISFAVLAGPNNASIKTVPKIINKAVRTNIGHVMREAIKNTNSLNRVKNLHVKTFSPAPSYQPVKPIFMIKSKYSDSMTSLSFSQDKKWLVTGGKNGYAQLWNLHTGQKLYTMDSGCGAVLSTGFTTVKDKHLIVTGHTHGGLCFWKLENGEQEVKITPHKKDIFFVSGVWDNHLITGSKDGSIKLKNLEIPKLTKTLLVKGLASITVDTIDKRLITGTVDGRITIWNLNTLEIESVLQQSGSSVLSLDVNKNKYLASGSEDGHVKVWNLWSGRRILDRAWHKSPVQSLSFNAKGSVIASADHSGVISLTSLPGGHKIGTLKGHSKTINKLSYLPDDNNILFSAGDDHVIKIWSTRHKTEVGRIISMKTGWAVLSPNGFFDGNLDGPLEDRLSSLKWQCNSHSLNMESFLENYYKPSLLNMVLLDKKIPGSERRVDISKNGILPPPTVTVNSPKTGIYLNKNSVDINFDIFDNGGGIDEIKCYNNGKIVMRELFDIRKNKPVKKSASIQHTFELVSGKNIFRFIGISRDRIEGQPTDIIIHNSRKTKKTNSALHILTVGINKYKNPGLDLKFSVPDADSLSKFFKKTYSRIFSNLYVHELFNNQATKNEIIKKLKSLTTISSEDTVLIYLAGHGDTIGDNWYYIPYELTSPNNPELLKRGALSSTLLQEYIEKIKAHQIILLLDSCKSGAAITAFDNIAMKRPCALLSNVTGIHIAAATSKNQLALELQELKHGLFTYSLLEGIDSKADLQPRDNNISVVEIMGYLRKRMPVLSSKYGIPTQYPVLNSMGMDFIISYRRGGA